jgi:asparagine synthase (glutamine-hydrolysing)
MASTGPAGRGILRVQRFVVPLARQPQDTPMCGIAGFLHADSARPADPETLRRMCATLVHRGPDGEGLYTDGPVGLGMRRLAVIDVAGGDQPLYDEEGTVVVIQNGEIYNYIELRAELEAMGHRFRTHSDTEVLAHGYEAWGDQLVSRLNGMWAFAIWDRRRRRLLLSRDRLGIKPLCWTVDGTRFLFASEIKALLAAGVATTPDYEVLDAYVAFGFVPEPYSLYRGVHKLPPGCNLVVEPGVAPRLVRWWRPPIVDESEARRDEDRIVEEFAALLTDAVRLQMRSDVPFGAFLSGGLDSASIVTLMSEQSAAPVRTFTIGFESRAYDERALARRVAERCSTDHVERVVEPADLETGLERLAWHFDEPFGDGSALATDIVSAVARERVTVVLTGDGGDEVLSGYTRYQGEKLSQAWGRLPAALRAGVAPRVLGAASAVLPGTSRDRLRRAARVLETANMSFEDRLTRKQSWSAAAVRGALLDVDGKHVRPAREFVEEAMRDCPARDPFHRLSWFDTTLMLPSQMLTKVDRMSMGRSLEARVPFLDHRLVELMAPVSARVKMPGMTRKHVLRRALGARLPSALLQAPKRGFNVPLREWFRGGSPIELLQRRVADGALDDLVRRPVLARLVDEHRAARADHGNLFWILLQLAGWCRRAGVPAGRA